jgi:hypothetical protein
MILDHRMGADYLREERCEEEGHKLVGEKIGRNGKGERTGIIDVVL